MDSERIADHSLQTMRDSVYLAKCHEFGPGSTEHGSEATLTGLRSVRLFARGRSGVYHGGLLRRWPSSGDMVMRRVGVLVWIAVVVLSGGIGRVALGQTGEDPAP